MIPSAAGPVLKEDPPEAAGTGGLRSLMPSYRLPCTQVLIGVSTTAPAIEQTWNRRLLKPLFTAHFIFKRSVVTEQLQGHAQCQYSRRNDLSGELQNHARSRVHLEATDSISVSSLHPLRHQGNSGTTGTHCRAQFMVWHSTWATSPGTPWKNAFSIAWKTPLWKWLVTFVYRQDSAQHATILITEYFKVEF